jgi:hypothetical protein
MQLCIPKCPDMCYRIDIGCYILESWEDVSIGVEWLPNFSLLLVPSQKNIVKSLHRKTDYSHISGQKKMQIFAENLKK